MLFFYTVHLLVYSQVITRILPRTILSGEGLLRGYLAFGLGIIILYPLCIGYRRLRRAYPNSILQLL